MCQLIKISFFVVLAFSIVNAGRTSGIREGKEDMCKEMCNEILTSMCEFNGYLLKIHDTLEFNTTEMNTDSDTIGKITDVIIESIIDQDISDYNSFFSEDCGKINDINDICFKEKSEDPVNSKPDISTLIIIGVVIFIVVCCFLGRNQKNKKSVNPN